ncbi:MAG TPA: chemotaxis protein CheB [Elusimicrobiota bacterium]|nr:chemotaxis protein CheB [Elusimicrobiota bacterium]
MARSKPRRQTRKTALPARVVGIGASPAALPSLKDLLKPLSKCKRMAFVLAESFDGEKLGLREALSKASPLPVVAARDGVPLAPGAIYAVPPGAEARVSQGKLELRPCSERTKGHVIDFLLVSIAREFGARAVGVVLAGPGTDGAQGLAAIRAQKGVTLSDDPQTSRPNAMPAAAVSAGAVDFVLAPAHRRGARGDRPASRAAVGLGALEGPRPAGRRRRGPRPGHRRHRPQGLRGRLHPLQAHDSPPEDPTADGRAPHERARQVRRAAASQPGRGALAP